MYIKEEVMPKFIESTHVLIAVMHSLNKLDTSSSKPKYKKDREVWLPQAPTRASCDPGAPPRRPLVTDQNPLFIYDLCRHPDRELNPQIPTSVRIRSPIAHRNPLEEHLRLPEP